MTYSSLKRFIPSDRHGAIPFPGQGLLPLILCAVLFFPPTSLAIATNDNARIIHIHLSGSVNPGMLHFLRRAVSVAEAEDAELLLIELNTPGGLVRTMREMIQTIMASRVPIVIYVAPSGAQAASAGALLTVSAHIAAMAPGTNIGAAHPVLAGGGPDKGSAMNEKIENDMAALARGIAKQRGRNVQWTEDAVRKSVSATADEALKLKVIDFVAPTVDRLLEIMDGLKVETADGTRTLHLSRYNIEKLSPDLREKVMCTIADPDIAYILLMIGAAGLYFELAHPGGILPGVAGAISLILGLFAMQVLPVSTTGMLLLVLALVLFILELFITSHGILAAAGVISLVFGSMMLYDTPSTGIALSGSVMWPTVIVCGLFFMTIAILAARAQLSRVRSGREGLVGERGRVRQTTGPDGGKVFVHGELWNARSENVIEEGEEAVVEEVDGMTLIVRRAEEI